MLGRQKAVESAFAMEVLIGDVLYLASHHTTHFQLEMASVKHSRTSYGAFRDKLSGESQCLLYSLKPSKLDESSASTKNKSIYRKLKS